MRNVQYGNILVSGVFVFCFAGSAALAQEAVKVTLKDGDLGFKDLTIKGETRFNIQNAGEHDHALEIEGDIGGKEFSVASRVLKPGQRSVFIVKLPEGSYDAYCPVDEHRAKGMAGKITAQ